MKPLPITLRLAAAFCLLAAVLVVVGWQGISHLRQLNAQIQNIAHDRWEEELLSHQAYRLSSQNSQITLLIFLVDDPDKIQQLLVQRAANTQRITELARAIEPRLETEKDKQLFAVVKARRTSYIESYERALSLLMSEHKRDEARKMMVDVVRPNLIAYHNAWGAFDQHGADEIDQVMQQSKVEFAVGQRDLLLVLALAGFIGSAIAVFTVMRVDRENASSHRAEQSLQQAHDELEARVVERTAELANTNEALRVENAERKQTENALRASEKKFQDLFESSRDAIETLEPSSWKFTSGNPAAVKMFRARNEEELTSLGPSDLSPERQPDGRASGEKAKEMMETAIREGSHYFEWMHRRIGGEEFPTTVLLSRMQSAERMFLQATVRDITERKRVEEALQERAKLAALEADVGTALTRGGTFAEMLRLCSEAIVRHLDGAFARIWTLNEREKMLELQASAGRYTHLNGPHGRVPVGKFKIGLIAEERKPHLTNQVVGDPRVGDQEWAKREGMVAFAGYPLLVEDRLVGVVAMFACHTLTDTTLQALASISNNIAVGIERKRAEEALRASQQIIEEIINAIPVRVFWKDKNLVYLGCNAVFARDAGFADPKDIIGKDDYQMGWRDQAEKYRGDDRQIIESGCSKLLIEESQTTPEGNTITLLSSKLPLRNSKGEISGVLGTYMDITERKQAEEALRKQEHLLSESQRLGHIGSWFYDVKGPIAWSAELYRVYGVLPDTFIPTVESLLNLIHPDDRAAMQAWLSACAAGKKPQDLEFRINRPDGTIRFIRGNGEAVFDAENKLIYMAGTGHDITERKKAEEVLRQRAKLQDQLVHTAAAVPGMIYSLRLRPDGSTQMPYASGALSDIFDLQPDDLIEDAVPIFSLIHPDDLGHVQATIAESARTLNPWRDEFRVRHTRLGEIWVEGHSVPQREPDGSILWHGFVQDVTGRKRLEAQVFQSQKLETVGKLAGGIAHEFNSILTAIIGQSELLLGDLPAGSPLAKNATEIRKAAERVATLTRQLLAYGRKQTLQPETLDLNHVLAGMEGMLRPLMGSNVDLLIVPAVGLPAVKADAGQIEQVIMNIAINAREAMPHGGKLTLETSNVAFDPENVVHYPGLRKGNYTMLAITDTGTGMSEEVTKRLFEPFFTTKEVGQGTGLGLATCYGIVKQSGGHIGAYSELGKGTVFKIYLPQTEPEDKAAPHPYTSPDLPRGTETILLVEDDPSLREMASLLLQRLGYAVLAATNGDQALHFLQQRDAQPIDLLFTDVVMPQMGGKDLSERVLAAHPETKVLFTSAYTETAIVHQGVLDPAVSLLQKPFTPAALALKVRELLDA